MLVTAGAGVIDFAHAADAKLVTSFAFSPGTHNTEGVWTADQARQLLDYTKACGGGIAAAEFVNEPTYAATGGPPPGYNAADYRLLDQNTDTHRPNYWAALLWRRLMGPVVLNAGPSQPDLHLYAHSLQGHPGGVALLAINTSRDRSESLALPPPADRYTLTARKLEDTHVQLDGHELKLGANDALPSLAGQHIPAGPLKLAPASITFLAIAEAGNANSP